MKNRLFAMVMMVILFVGMLPLPAIAANNEAVYNWNLEVYCSKATDEATLEYYRHRYKSDNDEIVNLAVSITEGVSSDYDKIRAVHDWVSDNIWYDKDAQIDPSKAIISLEGVLEVKRSICDGYARLTAYLLGAVGIPVKSITGFALGASGCPTDFYNISYTKANHAWNEAYAEGRWIILDATWDSQNIYENGIYSNRLAHTDTYFDISLEDISKTHRYLDYTDYSYIDGYIIDNSTYELQGLYRFYEKDLLTEIIIPDGVKVISNSAFIGCSNLFSVVIPNSVTSLQDYAFYNCLSLTTIIIPDTVVYIGSYTFGAGYRFDPETNTQVIRHIPNLTIYGNTGSYAEAYANEHSITFVAGLPSTTPSSWAVEQVNIAIAAGIVPQSLQSRYTQPITRSEYCVLAVSLYEKIMGTEITGRIKFDDTNDENVEKMAAVGVVNGLGNNRFDPNAQLTREQAAAVLVRLAEVAGKPLDKKSAIFADNAAISLWAFESVGQVQSAGIMGGIGNNVFAPKDHYTREQSIVTMIRLFNYLHT